MSEPAPRLVVSACLLGRACRYDGASRHAPPVQRLVDGWAGEVVAVCPEELGALGTPRPAATLRGGAGAAVLAGEAGVVRVADGADLTGAFVSGAEQAGALAEGAALAVLKARSPSCGCGETSVDGALAPGDGVFAALLRSRGVRLLTDEQVP